MSKKKRNNSQSESTNHESQSGESTRNSKSTRSYWYIGLVAALLGGFLYANTIGHEYTLDDFSVIKDNFVTKMGIEGIPTIFESEYRYGAWSSPGSLYRPLSSTIFAIQWQMSPDNPMLGHIFNILLYALTGWVLWNVWRRVLKAHSTSMIAMAVLFFMAHPIHTEVVSNIKSLDEILALLFSTLALGQLWRYYDGQKSYRLLFAVFLYGVALFCKESSITYLAIFPLTTWFFRNNVGKKMLVTAAFIVPAALYLTIRYLVLSAQNGVETYSILDNFIVGAPDIVSKFASAVMMCGFYLYRLFLPITLVSDMGYPQMSPVGMGDWRVLLSLLVYAGAIVWALLHLRQKHFLSFAILYYMITFSLFSNVFFTIGTSYGERVLYVPSLGFSFGLAWVIWYLFGRKSENTPVALFGVAGIILLFYGIRTIMRTPAWENSFTLYSADRVTSPNCAKLQYHSALEEANQAMDEDKETLVDKTLMEKAIESYSNALKLYPKYHDAYGGRGLAYFRLQNYEKAMADYQEAIKHRPNDARVLSNMGFIYFAIRKDIASAEDVYKKAIQYDPRFVDARRNLGAVYATTGRFELAIEQFEEALKFAPNNATLWFYKGSALRDMGKVEEAQPFLNKAYELDSSLRPK